MNYFSAVLLQYCTAVILQISPKNKGSCSRLVRCSVLALISLQLSLHRRRSAQDIECPLGTDGTGANFKSFGNLEVRRTFLTFAFEIKKQVYFS